MKWQKSQNTFCFPLFCKPKLDPRGGTKTSPTYKVRHSKVNKVIWLKSIEKIDILTFLDYCQLSCGRGNRILISTVCVRRIETLIVLWGSQFSWHILYICFSKIKWKIIKNCKKIAKLSKIFLIFCNFSHSLQGVTVKSIHLF